VTSVGAAGPLLLAPASTAAVVLGAHDWTEAGLTTAPSFLRSANELIAYLSDRDGLGLDRELVFSLFDDQGEASNQLRRVRDFLDWHIRTRRDAGCPLTDLLVYYIGHGHTDDQGDLYMLVRQSSHGMETQTAIKATDLRDTLRISAPQQRRYLILDCCFSEAAARALIGMGNLNQQVGAAARKDFEDNNPKRGTILLCSSPVGHVSIGPPKADRTLFTGAVLEVLREGIEGDHSYLSFADLRDAAFDRMVENFGAKAPRPVLHQVNAAAGDLTRAPAFPNRANAALADAALVEEPEASEPEASEPGYSDWAQRRMEQIEAETIEALGLDRADAPELTMTWPIAVWNGLRELLTSKNVPSLVDYTAALVGAAGAASLLITFLYQASPATGFEIKVALAACSISGAYAGLLLRQNGIVGSIIVLMMLELLFSFLSMLLLILLARDYAFGAPWVFATVSIISGSFVLSLSVCIAWIWQRLPSRQTVIGFLRWIALGY
jgi:hypothetical protein